MMRQKRSTVLLTEGIHSACEFYYTRALNKYGCLRARATDWFRVHSY